MSFNTKRCGVSLYPHTELYAYLGEVERGEGRNKYSGARGISLGFGFDLQNHLMIADDRKKLHNDLHDA